jgi:hypothetical protein
MAGVFMPTRADDLQWNLKGRGAEGVKPRSSPLLFPIAFCNDGSLSTFDHTTPAQRLTAAPPIQNIFFPGA